MARKQAKPDTSSTAGAKQSRASLDDDDDFNDADVGEELDLQETSTQAERLQARRRLEDYFEEKRLREQLGDDFF